MWEVPSELADKRKGRGEMRECVATEDHEVCVCSFP